MNDLAALSYDNVIPLRQQPVDEPVDDGSQPVDGAVDGAVDGGITAVSGLRVALPPQTPPTHRIGASSNEEAEKKRARNVAWEALIEIFGFEPRTDSDRRAWGKITTSLNRAEATREEILDAVSEYRKTWPNAELTIWALEKWFTHFASKARARNTTRAATCSYCKVGGGRHSAECELQ